MDYHLPGQCWCWQELPSVWPSGCTAGMPCEGALRLRRLRRSVLARKGQGPRLSADFFEPFGRRCRALAEAAFLNLSAVQSKWPPVSWRHHTFFRV